MCKSGSQKPGLHTGGEGKKRCNLATFYQGEKKEDVSLSFLSNNKKIESENNFFSRTEEKTLEEEEEKKS
jgi:hypothetical protein